jgi:hypothetical protein
MWPYKRGVPLLCNGKVWPYKSRGWSLKVKNLLVFYYISVYLKSGVIRGVVYGESSLVRGETIATVQQIKKYFNIYLIFSKKKKKKGTC